MPLRQRRRVGPLLERIARRDDPPDLVEPQALEGGLANQAVGGMGRIERPAEQANGLTRRRDRRVSLDAAEAGGSGWTHVRVG